MKYPSRHIRKGVKKKSKILILSQTVRGRGDLKDHIFKITIFGYNLNNSGHILSLLLAFKGFIG